MCTTFGEECKVIRLLLGRNTFKSYIMDSIFGQKFHTGHATHNLLVYGMYSMYQAKEQGVLNVLHIFKVHQAISSGDHQ